MRAVELFSGIGGFRLASEKYGIETVWANDIDRHASNVYRDRFGTENYVEGDIWELLEDIPAHDILTAGFPCQPFSSAGKKQGIKDPRGTLFEAIVRSLKKHQPNYFVLENVKRLLSMDDGLHFATILSSLAELDYKIEWRLLNAMNFSLPQNRQRVVIVGVHKRKLSAEDNNVRLATHEELEGLSQNELSFLINEENWSPLEKHGSAFPNWGVVNKGKFFSTDLKFFSSKLDPVILKDILAKDVDPIFDLTQSTEKWIKKNTSVNKFVGGVEVLSNQAGGARMGYTIFGVNGVAPTLTSSTSRHYERYKIEGKYRRLTPEEYATIQGFPKNHCCAAPLREQYVLYGNAVPPPLISWVMERLFSSPEVKIRDVGVKNEPLPLKFIKEYV